MVFDAPCRYVLSAGCIVLIIMALRVVRVLVKIIILYILIHQIHTGRLYR